MTTKFDNNCRITTVEKSLLSKADHPWVFSVYTQTLALVIRFEDKKRADDFYKLLSAGNVSITCVKPG